MLDSSDLHQKFNKPHCLSSIMPTITNHSERQNKGLIEKVAMAMIVSGNTVVNPFEACEELKADNIDITCIFKKLHSGMLPILQTEQEMQSTQRAPILSSSQPPRDKMRNSSKGQKS
ncbi:hypothetical protein M9H77_02543 [Catharanthus roseus]|uniref:Uncharacterized protein n=1 Tax=Catharanthus roseus TaxID=4058 RepID=A0ACC0C8R3_CATRO|nr:hypothetical protein M9H77_02543 [Catharanthus roseus]